MLCFALFQTWGFSLDGPPYSASRRACISTSTSGRVSLLAGPKTCLIKSKRSEAFPMPEPYDLDDASRAHPRLHRRTTLWPPKARISRENEHCQRPLRFAWRRKSFARSRIRTDVVQPACGDNGHRNGEVCSLTGFSCERIFEFRDAPF